jgi:RNA polymerase sigma-70 factor, ECF subfamily
MEQRELRGLGDSALVIAVGRFDHDALHELYRRHAGPVFALALRLLADRSRAEDVTQEVFLWLWDHPERFDAGRGTLRTLLLSICHSRAVDLIRSEASRRQREDRDSQSLTVDIDSIEREIVDFATAEEVRMALKSLSEDEQDCIRLTYFEGHSYRDAARILKQPEGTIKGRIRSGFKQLRNRLGDLVEEA